MKLRIALTIALLAVGAASFWPPEARAQAGEPPNILFVLSDDQRTDTMRMMPATIGNFPVRFKNMFVTTALCCPSRSSFLTGQYARKTGVTTNFGYPTFQVREPESVGPWLQAQGYYTGFVGKYFNHYTVADPAPPGWDEFYGKVWNADGSSIGDAFNFALRERYMDGSTQRDEIVHYPNAQHPEPYITSIVSDLATRFVDRAESPEYNPDGKPWALLVWPNAPNAGKPETQYANAPLPTWNKRPSYLEKDMRDKPAEIRRSPYRAAADIHRQQRASQLRQLLSVDDMVDRLFKKLQALGIRSETWGFYSSDNGRLWGEHHLSRKLYAYEESIRVPLRMWIPGRGRTTITQLVANIDVTPTLLALAGDSSAHGFDGRSLVPLLQGSTAGWRTATLVENWAFVRFNALRTKRWKYVRYSKSGHQELYDLRSDPYELDNSWADHPGVIANLRTRMLALMRQ